MKVNLSSFLQSRKNIFLYRKLGWKLALSYIILLGKLYLFFNQKEKRKIEKAVGIVFAENSRRYKLGNAPQKVFHGIFSHYYEKLFNAYSCVETLKAFFNLRVRARNMELLSQGLSRGNGILLITGHFGGVEFIPAYLGTLGFPVTIIVRFSSIHLRQISFQKADQFKTKIIDADNTPNVMKAIFDNLKENRIVITQCDEIDEWRPSKNEKISFLGKNTHLDRTMNVLARRCGPEILFAVMHRRNPQDYTFVVSSKEQMQACIPAAAQVSVGALVLKFLERHIYAYPEQWYQWKKYFEIDGLIRDAHPIPSPAIPPALEPSFGKAS